MSKLATPEMDRSKEFFAATCAAIEDGMTAADFEDLCREYPDGCAEKYLKRQDRLHKQIEHIWLMKAPEVEAREAVVMQLVQPGKQRFTLTRFDQISLRTTGAYLVKGIIPRTGLIIIWGPPKCGKSFWTFDCVMHVALGRPYRGHRVQSGPVVYLALEGGAGFRSRVKAFKVEHGVTDAPFYLITDRADLVKDHKAS